MNVILSHEQIDEAHALACRSIARWAHIRGHYNNRLRSHLIGKLGEIAAASFLDAAGLALTRHFLDATAERLCDISVNRTNGRVTRIEVKTWAAQYWPDLGRCIAIDQYSALCQKCDVVFWCVLSGPIPVIETTQYDTLDVDVGKWSTVDDIARAPQRWTGRNSMRKVHNYQFDETSLRDSDSLLSLLKGEA